MATAGRREGTGSIAFTRGPLISALSSRSEREKENFCSLFSRTLALGWLVSHLSLIYSRSKAEEEMRCCCESEMK